MKDEEPLLSDIFEGEPFNEDGLHVDFAIGEDDDAAGEQDGSG